MCDDGDDGDDDDHYHWNRDDDDDDYVAEMDVDQIHLRPMDVVARSKGHLVIVFHDDDDDDADDDPDETYGRRHTVHLSDEIENHSFASACFDEYDIGCVTLLWCVFLSQREHRRERGHHQVVSY